MKHPTKHQVILLGIATGIATVTVVGSSVLIFVSLSTLELTFITSATFLFQIALIKEFQYQLRHKPKI